MQPAARGHRCSSIMSLSGVILILPGFFLPMYTYQGHGTDVVYSETTWQIATSLVAPAGMRTNWPFVLLFSLPLLLACFIGGISVRALFRELSLRLVQMRRVAARAGFLIQFCLAVFSFLSLSIALSVSINVGFVLMLFGFALTLIGASPHATTQRILIHLLFDTTVFLILSLASIEVSLPRFAGVGIVRLGLLVSYGILVGLIHLIMSLK